MKKTMFFPIIALLASSLFIISCDININGDSDGGSDSASGDVTLPDEIDSAAQELDNFPSQAEATETTFSVNDTSVDGSDSVQLADSEEDTVETSVTIPSGLSKRSEFAEIIIKFWINGKLYTINHDGSSNTFTLKLDLKKGDNYFCFYFTKGDIQLRTPVIYIVALVGDEESGSDDESLTEDQIGKLITGKWVNIAYNFFYEYETLLSFSDETNSELSWGLVFSKSPLVQGSAVEGASKIVASHTSTDSTATRESTFDEIGRTSSLLESSEQGSYSATFNYNSNFSGTLAITEPNEEILDYEYTEFWFPLSAISQSGGEPETWLYDQSSSRVVEHISNILIDTDNDGTAETQATLREEWQYYTADLPKTYSKFVDDGLIYQAVYTLEGTKVRAKQVYDLNDDTETIEHAFTDNYSYNSLFQVDSRTRVYSDGKTTLEYYSYNDDRQLLTAREYSNKGSDNTFFDEFTLSRTYTFQYDEAGRLTAVVESVGNTETSIYTYEYEF